jgi:hypothetical protein
MFILSFILWKSVVFLSGNRFVLVFRLFMSEGVEIQLTGLAPPHLCACSKAELGFSTLYVVVFCVQWDEIRDEFSCY